MIGWRTAAIGLATALLSAGCTGPIQPRPTPISSSSGTPATSQGSSTSATLSVELVGEMHCAGFPDTCRATLSLLPPDTALPTDWLPPDSDPWWGPAWDGMTATTFQQSPVGALPQLPGGRSQLVVLVLGSSDVVSFRPDGRRGEDRLGECALEVDVDAGTTVVPIRVTYQPVDPSTFAVACAIHRR